MAKVRLGDYVRIRTGKLDANAADQNGKYPFFTCSIVPLCINTYSYDCECVLVAGNGDLNVKYYNGKFDAYQRTYIVESLDNKLLSVPYLYRFMDKYIETLRNISIGGVIKYIKLGNLTEASINLPTISKQNEIVDVLSIVDNLIKGVEQQLADLDILVKSRFVEMFGDLNSNEKNWGKESLKHHAKVIVGYPFKSKDYTETGIRIVGGYNLMQGYVVWSECKYWERIDGYEKYLLEADDIVMAMDRPWVNGGFKISKIDGRELPALLIQRTACIRAIDIEQDYLYMLLNSDCFAEHCNIKGSLVPHISNKDIDSFEIFIPPHELQMEFAYFIKQVDKSKLAIQQSLDELETLKKSLMQQYFG